MIDGIKNWVDAQTETDRVRITIGDGHLGFKSIELTPGDAHTLAIELATAAYEAMGVKNPTIYIAVAH